MIQLNSNFTKKLSFVDNVLFWLISIFLFFTIFFSAQATIQTDAIDYYVMLQQLTGSADSLIIDQTPFLNQRSPGFSLLALPAYYFLELAVNPLVNTHTLKSADLPPPKPPAFLKPGRRPPKRAHNFSHDASEHLLLPSRPVLAKDLLFKNIILDENGRLFQWKIMLALLITSYTMLVMGIVFSVKTLALIPGIISGRVFPMITIVTSGIFLHNIIQTPAYATMTVFGLSSLFCYFIIKSNSSPIFKYQFSARLFAGLLMLTRHETVVMFMTLMILLFISQKWSLLRNLFYGSLISLFILLVYNQYQFGDWLHLAMLEGNINQLGFDLGYMATNLFHPQAGLFFHSTLIVIGLIGLMLVKGEYPKYFGISALALLSLYLVRIPIMYTHIGSGVIEIAGLPIQCPSTWQDALMLLRSDINRYVIVLAPFAIIGLKSLLTITIKEGNQTNSSYL